MRSRLRDSAGWLAGAAAGAAALGVLTLATADWRDYGHEARPAVDALVHGHIARLLHLAPAYGGSLILRAPFVLAAHWFGGGEGWMYRASVLPAILGLGLAGRLRQAGVGWVPRAVVLGLVVLNPMAIQAVQWGHPEELLGAALCVGAVLCALGERPVWAGLLLGLAVANKEWAVLATGPVLIALPRQRIRALACASVVAGVLVIPFMAAGSPDLGHGLSVAMNSGTMFTRWQLWWFFGAAGHVHPHMAPVPVIGYRSQPAWVGSLAHPLIVVIWLPLSLLHWRTVGRRSDRAPLDALLLLALLLLLRCVLDPWDISYYSLPFLIALLSWESLARQHAPVAALAATITAWLLYVEILRLAPGLSTDQQSLIFLVASMAAGAAMALRLWSNPRTGPHPLALAASPPSEVPA